MVDAPALPSGRVTFAFVDVVGSTRTFHEHGDAYVAAQRELHTRIAHHAGLAGGVVVATEGDGAFLAFSDATSAVSALVTLQDELENADGEGLRLRLRSGAHTGDAVPVDGNYLAVAVHVAARVAGTANAGQVLVTDAVVEELGSSGGAAPVEVGAFDLKDLPEPTRIWRVAGDPTPPRATPSRRTNVRVPRTTFVGRSGELERLWELVSTPGLVTVVGPGGTGKTRLVSELALRGDESLPGGAWLAELAPLEAPDQIVSVAGAAVGLTSAGVEQLVDVLRVRGRCALVLDNCEHLLDGVSGLIETLLEACPDLTLLCTSREALDLDGERVWTLPPLDPDGSATQLFLDRATDVAEATPDLGLVYQLCEALDGLPLAIELAASQARSAPLTEILDAVVAGTDALARRGGASRQRSLDAVLEWSLERLKPQVRASLLVLSVFPGRFSPDMARTVLIAAHHGDPGAVKVLTRGSLVDLDGADYRLLSTVRAAARRQLEQSPDLHREAMDALVAWALAYGEERYRILTTHEDIPEDTLLALEAALDHGLSVGCAGLGRAFHCFEVASVTRGAGTVARSLARRAVRIEVCDRDTATLVTAGVHLLEHQREDCGVAPETFRTMRTLAADAGDWRLLVDVLHGEATREGNLGRWETCIALWQEAHLVAERHVEARHELPGTLGNLGVAYYYSGDLARSAEYAERALQAAIELGIRHVRVVSHMNLADWALTEDRRVDARDHALAALKHAPPNFMLRGVALAQLARALNRLGDPSSAVVAGSEALQLLDAQPANPHLSEELGFLLAEMPELRAQ
jgi:predicted ATPase/class 3 adenylate cyclase